MNYFAAAADRSETSLDPQEIAAVDRINSGDHDARFRTVVLPHLDDAYTLACWLTGSRTDSEDVVQEACLRAYRAIGSYSTGNARAWVLTIVRNTAFNWMRTNRRACLFPPRTWRASSARDPAISMTKRPRRHSSPKTRRRFSRSRLRRCRMRSGKRWSCATFRILVPRDRRGVWDAGRHGNVAASPGA